MLTKKCLGKKYQTAMKIDIKKNVLKYYESGYKKQGADNQRKYPNEELCRFMGRHFFHLNWWGIVNFDQKRDFISLQPRPNAELQ